jgi:hypothetical protein
MSDDGSFLARWSHRKRSAATLARAQPNRDGKAGEAGPVRDPPAPFDPASLPSLDSIVADSDISAFLAANVPVELTRAALRRAWSADPAIRDFVGLSENSWDFNAPGGVPGFGSVSAEDVERLLARVIGTGEDSGAAAEPPPSDAVEAGEQLVAARSVQDRLRQNYGTKAADSDLAPLRADDAALRHDAAEEESAPAMRRRAHGGALPE